MTSKNAPTNNAKELVFAEWLNVFRDNEKVHEWFIALLNAKEDQGVKVAETMLATFKKLDKNAGVIFQRIIDTLQSTGAQKRTSPEDSQESSNNQLNSGEEEKMDSTLKSTGTQKRTSPDSEGSSNNQLNSGEEEKMDSTLKSTGTQKRTSPDSEGSSNKRLKHSEEEKKDSPREAKEEKENFFKRAGISNEDGLLIITPHGGQTDPFSLLQIKEVAAANKSRVVIVIDQSASMGTTNACKAKVPQTRTEQLAKLLQQLRSKGMVDFVLVEMCSESPTVLDSQNHVPHANGSCMTNPSDVMHTLRRKGMVKPGDIVFFFTDDKNDAKPELFAEGEKDFTFVQVAFTSFTPFEAGGSDDDAAQRVTNNNKYRSRRTGTSGGASRQDYSHQTAAGDTYIHSDVLTGDPRSTNAILPETNAIYRALGPSEMATAVFKYCEDWGKQPVTVKNPNPFGVYLRTGRNTFTVAAGASVKLPFPLRTGEVLFYQFAKAAAETPAV
jgi:hypothetical protein